MTGIQTAGICLTVSLLALPTVLLSGALLGWAISATLTTALMLVFEVRAELRARRDNQRRIPASQPIDALFEPDFWFSLSAIVAGILWVATAVQAFLF